MNKTDQINSRQLKALDLLVKPTLGEWEYRTQLLSKIVKRKKNYLSQAVRENQDCDFDLGLYV